MGTHGDVRDHRRYVEALYDAVLSGGPRRQVPLSAKTIDQPAEIRQLEAVQGVAAAQYRRGL